MDGSSTAPTSSRSLGALLVRLGDAYSWAGGVVVFVVCMLWLGFAWLFHAPFRALAMAEGGKREEEATMLEVMLGIFVPLPVAVGCAFVAAMRQEAVGGERWSLLLIAASVAGWWTFAVTFYSLPAHDTPLRRFEAASLRDADQARLVEFVEDAELVTDALGFVFLGAGEVDADTDTVVGVRVDDEGLVGTASGTVRCRFNTGRSGTEDFECELTACVVPIHVQGGARASSADFWTNATNASSRAPANDAVIFSSCFIPGLNRSGADCLAECTAAEARMWYSRDPSRTFNLPAPDNFEFDMPWRADQMAMGWRTFVNGTFPSHGGNTENYTLQEEAVRNLEMRSGGQIVALRDERGGAIVLEYGDFPVGYMLRSADILLGANLGSVFLALACAAGCPLGLYMYNDRRKRKKEEKKQPRGKKKIDRN